MEKIELCTTSYSTNLGFGVVLFKYKFSASVVIAVAVVVAVDDVVAVVTSTAIKNNSNQFFIDKDKKQSGLNG